MKAKNFTKYGVIFGLSMALRNVFLVELAKILPAEETGLMEFCKTCSFVFVAAIFVYGIAMLLIDKYFGDED